jgi:hypothetical protein
LINVGEDHKLLSSRKQIISMFNEPTGVLMDNIIPFKFKGFAEREPITLSQARHDLHLMPKQFETNLEPIRVDQQGEPILVILSPALMGIFASALAYIATKGLQEDFDAWAKEPKG